MRVKRRHWLPIALLGAVGIGAAVYGFTRYWRPDLSDVDSITLIYDRHEDYHEVIEDPVTIGLFTDAVRLWRKSPCKCAHFEEVLFRSPGGTIRATICNHCFDVRQDRGPLMSYSMPDTLWALYSARKRAWLQGHPGRVVPE